ncbi:MAG TPA: hypothetical protein VMM60_11345 [Ilumatobacter sp.]|nr:hypothetical protein [Ilumatobacter sp.]
MVSTDHPDQAVHHDTSRSLLLTGAAVSIGSLAIGWIMGGAATENNTAASPATTAAATTTTERIIATIEAPDTTTPSGTAPSGTAPSDTSSSDTSPTTVSPSAVSPAQTDTVVRAEVVRGSTAATVSWASIPPGTPIDLTLPDDLQGLPYEIAVVDGSGAAYRIDLASATVRRYPGRIGQPSALAFVNDGQLLRYNRWDSSGRTLVALDGTTTMLSLPGSGQVGIDGTGTLWSVDFEGSPFGDARRFDQYGNPLGESFAMPTSGGIMFDPAGGLIVIDASGAYELDDDGAAMRLAVGDILALGATTAIVRECDAELVCSSFIVDRASGERRQIALDEIVAAGPPPTDADGATTSAILPPYGWLSQGAGATVIGNIALLPLQEVSETGSYLRESFALVDIEEDRMIGRARTGYPAPAMTADGAWVFSIDPTSGIVATNTTTGSAQAIDLDHRDGFYALAVRGT